MSRRNKAGKKASFILRYLSVEEDGNGEVEDLSQNQLPTINESGEKI